MPLKVDGEKKSLTVIIKKSDAQEMRRLAAEHTTEFQDVSVSDVARVVIRRGLDTLKLVPLAHDLTRPGIDL